MHRVIAFAPIACLSLAVGCAAPVGSVDQQSIEVDSRRAILAINSGFESVLGADMPEDLRVEARRWLVELSDARTRLDVLAARSAGQSLSPAEAAEIEASLALLYRTIEGLASRNPMALALDGAELTPEARDMLGALERLLR
ncbi:MAG: hypothetical protein AAFR96_07230 [Planctomycetota bacterium]